MTIREIFGIAAIATTALAGAASAAAQEAAEARSVFVNARIVTMGDAGLIADGCLTVVGDDITQVGATGECDTGGAVIIDAGGRTLMPGLADMHTHYSGGNAGIAYVANGVTTVRVPWGSLANAEANQRVMAGTDMGPFAYYSGPLIDGPDPIWGAGAVSATTPEMIEGVVESQRASGYRAVKLYAKLDADTYRAGVAAAKERDLQIWTHVPASLTLGDVLDLEVDSIEHLDGYAAALVRDDFERPESGRTSVAQWAATDAAKMESLVERTKEAGVWNCVTFNVLIDMFLNAENADEFLASNEAATVDAGLKQWWSGSRDRLAADAPRVREGVEARYQFVKALHDAGAGLLIGTDAPNPFVPYGPAIHRELAHFEAAGLTPEDVLRIATVQAARFLGEDEVFGKLEAGMRADIVMVDGDPLTDLSVLKVPAGVMVHGHWYDRSELDRRLAEI